MEIIYAADKLEDKRIKPLALETDNQEAGAHSELTATRPTRVLSEDNFHTTKVVAFQ